MASRPDKKRVSEGQGFELVRRASGELSLSGRMDHDAAVDAREQGERLLAEDPGPWRINLRGLESAHSGVLSLLLCFLRAADRHQRSITFVEMPDRLYDMARMSGLDQLLPLEQRG